MVQTCRRQDHGGRSRQAFEPDYWDESRHVNGQSCAKVARSPCPHNLKSSGFVPERLFLNPRHSRAYIAYPCYSGGWHGRCWRPKQTDTAVISDGRDDVAADCAHFEPQHSREQRSGAGHA
ncbi:hypothetical protein CTRI78_v007014 [Colletotrichum trifolii]|uniref:Uncharacterized protein n=1 Tax=Colletotrichum trifolii TaxID=5466 RepID=A0A4R8RAY8_COLTR|nr:hypothetical protein CTRI78_v007014 [Colletotrichum trifolii]